MRLRIETHVSSAIAVSRDIQQSERAGFTALVLFPWLDWVGCLVRSPLGRLVGGTTATATAVALARRSTRMLLRNREQRAEKVHSR